MWQNLIIVIADEVSAMIDHAMKEIPAAALLNSTPFVRQYDILSNRWGDLLCQEENRTNDIRRNSRKWL